jgi:hypothetical protein
MNLKSGPDDGIVVVLRVKKLQQLDAREKARIATRTKRS